MCDVLEISVQHSSPNIETTRQTRISPSPQVDVCKENCLQLSLQTRYRASLNDRSENTTIHNTPDTWSELKTFRARFRNKVEKRAFRAFEPIGFDQQHKIRTYSNCDLEKTLTRERALPIFEISKRKTSEIGHTSGQSKARNRGPGACACARF